MEFKERMVRDHKEWFERLRATNDIATARELDEALDLVPEPYKEIVWNIMNRINQYSSDVLALIDQLEIDINKITKENL